MSVFSRNSAAAVTVALAAACSSHETPPPAVPATEAAAPAAKAPAPEKSGDDADRSQIAISDEIRKKCGLSDEDAYFAFDSSRVRQHDRDILRKIARCFVSGPLAGHQMKLVGHADPRGEEEYNMVLGGKRADHVKAVMVAEGMPGQRVSSTSRGAMDATGSDEASWSKDRRVDVLVGG